MLENLDSRHTLLAVGRLVYQKGFDRLLSGFSQLAALFPKWDLVILGEGRLRGKLEQQVENLKLQNRVYLPGVVGNIGDWYEQADLYVMTSRFEGFPNTLIEGLAYGLPVVSVDCETGPRDILRHHIDGLLVPQDDETALVDALRCLMADERMRHQFGSRAVEARQRFSVDRVAAQFECLFKEAMIFKKS